KQRGPIAEYEDCSDVVEAECGLAEVEVLEVVQAQRVVIAAREGLQLRTSSQRGEQGQVEVRRRAQALVGHESAAPILGELGQRPAKVRLRDVEGLEQAAGVQVQAQQIRER